MNRNAKEEYKNRRIRGAKFFDLDNNFSDHSSPYPHMLPSQKEFYNQVARIGVKPTDLVIAYDGVNFYTIFECKKKFIKILVGYIFSSQMLVDV